MESDNWVNKKDVNDPSGDGFTGEITETNSAKALDLLFKRCLKRCPFNLALSQAKYFYNYFSFFVIKILVWQISIEDMNFQFTTKTPMFFLAIVGFSFLTSSEFYQWLYVSIVSLS